MTSFEKPPVQRFHGAVGKAEREVAHDGDEENVYQTDSQIT
jgi:hypothetical protein